MPRVLRFVPVAMAASLCCSALAAAVGSPSIAGAGPLPLLTLESDSTIGSNDDVDRSNDTAHDFYLVPLNRFDKLTVNFEFIDIAGAARYCLQAPGTSDFTYDSSACVEEPDTFNGRKSQLVFRPTVDGQWIFDIRTNDGGGTGRHSYALTASVQKYTSLSLTVPRLAARGRTVILKGRLTGAPAGSSVLVERRIGSGRWKAVRVVSTDGAGGFLTRSRATQAGKYVFRARFFGDPGYQPSQRSSRMRVA